MSIHKREGSKDIKVVKKKKQKSFVKRLDEKIKKQLESIRKKRTKDNWKGDSILKSETSILKTDKKALSSGKSILKDKNIFLDHKANNPINKQDMFFKW